MSRDLSHRVLEGTNGTIDALESLFTKINSFTLNYQEIERERIKRLGKRKEEAKQKNTNERERGKERERIERSRKQSERQCHTNGVLLTVNAAP